MNLRLVMHPFDWNKLDSNAHRVLQLVFDGRVTVVDPKTPHGGKAYVIDDDDLQRIVQQEIDRRS